MRIQNILNQLLIPEYINRKVNEKEFRDELNRIEGKHYEHEFWQKNYQIKEGSRCFLLAPGPSINEIDLSLLKYEDTFGVNSIYKIAQKIHLDYYVYVSDWYWKQHLIGINNLECTYKFIPNKMFEFLDSSERNVFLNVHKSEAFNKIGGVRAVPEFFSRQPDKHIASGGTVLFLCLQIIFYMGYDEVVLVGVDHSYDEQKRSKFLQPGGASYLAKSVDHYHFDKQYVAAGTIVPINLHAMERAYELADAVFRGANKRIINASPRSKLEIFPRVDYEKLF